jgi:hypothetical protein
VVTYGVSTLYALDVIVPEFSPPYDIHYDAGSGDIWVAAWASGIRRSSDDGRTWQRVVLPPDHLDWIHPDTLYDFRLQPKTVEGNYNHAGFAVLVDAAGTVWAGTPVGINRSLDGGLSWRRFSYDGTPRGLTGSWVIAIDEQPAAGRNPIWMATWTATEAGERSQNGITVTRDGGETFEQVLLGERIYDFAFRGETVYAAGTAGLFITENGGRTWRTVRDFRDPTQPDRVVRPDVAAYAVATTGDALWVGTADGLVRSTDGGRTWRLFRTEVPLNPETPTAAIPRVDTYAYPNPFSPQADRFVRIRYELDREGDVELRIYDFGMNLVRRIAAGIQPQGTRETIWDGTDDGGLRTANGAYLYALQTVERTVWGKILLIE